MSRVSVVVAALIIAELLLTPPPLAAEPYLSLRTGLKCSTCHVNRTGGGGRNDFGSAWGQTQLPLRTVGIRTRNLNDWVALGFDVRSRFSAAASDASPQTVFDIPEAQVQLQATVIPNALSVYVDETVGPERASARELFALVNLPLGGWAKAGKFLLPYGWRLWDDNAYIRSETGFTYATPDVGVEVGIEPGPLSWSLAVSNGSQGGGEGDDGKMITSSAALIFPFGRVGASASRNASPVATTTAFGGFAGVRVGPVVVLGEADWIQGRSTGQPDRDQLVAYVEGDLLLHRGVNVKIAYGYHDRNLDVVEDQRIRMRFGVEIFPVGFAQLSLFYTLLDDIPQVTTDVDQIGLEAHIFF
ncbi:MAG TPA: hypothetical protein VGA22_13340 [Gemmatimonadales bacterium]|jgi:hypothetical protein